MRHSDFDINVLRRETASIGGQTLLGRTVVLSVLLLGLCGVALDAHAQQKIGYIDSQTILQKLPEYSTVQQKLEQLEKKWRAEIQSQKEEVQTLKEEFGAW